MALYSCPITTVSPLLIPFLPFLEEEKRTSQEGTKHPISNCERRSGKKTDRWTSFFIFSCLPSWLVRVHLLFLYLTLAENFSAEMLEIYWQPNVLRRVQSGKNDISGIARKWRGISHEKCWHSKSNVEIFFFGVDLPKKNFCGHKKWQHVGTVEATRSFWCLFSKGAKLDWSWIWLLLAALSHVPRRPIGQWPFWARPSTNAAYRRQCNHPSSAAGSYPLASFFPHFFQFTGKMASIKDNY